jgi:hypothetical protein
MASLLNFAAGVLDFRVVSSREPQSIQRRKDKPDRRIFTSSYRQISGPTATKTLDKQSETKVKVINRKNALSLDP